MEKEFTAICPLCGQEYSDHPALSRADNTTMICPDCGTREALVGIGLAQDEIERIIETVHQYRPKND